MLDDLFLDIRLNRPFYKKPIFIIFISLLSLIILSIVITIIILTHTKTEIIYPLSESSEFVINPDQGWFMHHKAIFNETGVRLLKANPDSVHHLLCDISRFSKVNNSEEDKLLTKEALDGLDNILQIIREANETAVPRFFYDGYSGKPDQEPKLDIIIKHLEQVAPIINKYPDVIIAIEAGFLGKWGEMHTSQIATPGNNSIIVRKWLENTNNIPILTRYMSTVYAFYNKSGIDDMEEVKIKKEDIGYWFGVWNDCQYGNEGDCGTFKVKDRDKEVEWLRKQHEHLPYGGEGNYFKETYIQNISYCIPDMYKVHTSYLNPSFHKSLIDGIWKVEIYNSSIAGFPHFNGKTGFDFIGAHFGYRLVIKNINITYGRNEFVLKIGVNNTGFGNVNKVKKIGLAFAYEDSVIDEKNMNKNKTIYKVFDQQNELGTFYGGSQVIKIKGKFPKNPLKEYGVYLRLYYEILTNGKVKYSIRFANINIYNEEVFGNLLFNVTKDNDIIKNKI